MSVAVSAVAVVVAAVNVVVAAVASEAFVFP